MKDLHIEQVQATELKKHGRAARWCSWTTSRLKAHYDPLGNAIIYPLQSRNLALVCVPFYSRTTCA